MFLKSLHNENMIPVRNCCRIQCLLNEQACAKIDNLADFHHKCFGQDILNTDAEV